VQFKNPSEVLDFARKTFGLEGIPQFELVEPVASGGGFGK
jgi:hypothetical protein